jgi:hypothetical protein
MMCRAFDSYLYVEDPQGTVLASDDDSGGNRDARVVLTVPAEIEVTLVATSYDSRGRFSSRCTAMATRPFCRGDSVRMSRSRVRQNAGRGGPRVLANAATDPQPSFAVRLLRPG